MHYIRQISNSIISVYNDIYNINNILIIIDICSTELYGDSPSVDIFNFSKLVYFKFSYSTNSNQVLPALKYPPHR